MTATDATRRAGPLASPLDRLVTRARRPRQRTAAATKLPVRVEVAQWCLISLAVLAIWMVGFGAAISSLAEHHSQHGLYVNFRQQLADGVAPLGGAMKEGSPVALLEAPTGGLHNVVVAEGSSGRDLRAGPGHFPGTPLPGQPGAVLLLGRSVSFGGPFGKITSMRPGDGITATTGQGTFKYVVEDVRRSGDPLPRPLPAGGGQLTLVTSEGAGWRLGWAPTHAVYVDAVLSGTSVPVASSTAISTSADAIMASDSGNLYQIVLWLQLLVILVVLVLVGKRRWGLGHMWLIGTPVLLAVLWQTTSTLWPLLPNII